MAELPQETVIVGVVPLQPVEGVAFTENDPGGEDAGGGVGVGAVVVTDTELEQLTQPVPPPAVSETNTRPVLVPVVE